ncbi:GGDEF domain-containing phosphodiesterase [Tissierella sp. Yu-01]|uniref:EAL domain-containing protein n=1 Tax=Tissierella sp. Yu-01 TaxID=3035694 RepID=UPI00240E5E50|nr:GGDEF domain-containing phosphodiesterase [Tissierella sp. Yu-01]WFA08612.1 GGDEF domain-containing phosphodiesterase [Tissierella sp. Yu-01]
MNIGKLFDIATIKEYRYFDIVASFLIFLMIILIGVFVYFTGGTTSFVHLMYIPILSTVFIFGIKEGIIASIIAGFVLGPHMPMHVSEGIMQQPSSWIFRIVMFIIITLVVGILLNYIKQYYRMEKKRAHQDPITGYPNLAKFKEDLTEMIQKKKYDILSLILFEYKNREMISQYVNHDTSRESFIQLVKIADEFFGTRNVYTVSTNKFIALIPDIDEVNAYERANEFYDKTKIPLYIDTLPISVIIKGGIVSYPNHSDEINDIILKLEKSLSQVSKSQVSIGVYNDGLELERKKYYDTLVSLYDSLQNDMFTLVYQPKVRIADNNIVGVEALLRLKNRDYNSLSIGRLINIAEDAGFINEITKWVILNSIKQIRSWQDQGIYIGVSINLSSADLNDESIINYTINCLGEYNIEPFYIEFELTERTIIEDEKRVFSVLNKIKEAGIKVSLDDYGTGYNSLRYLTKGVFPYDYIKIDKGFIDSICQKQNLSLLSGIIDTAHTLGIKVVAEGVEEEDQMNLLKEVGCDVIQGYYYCSPLPPEELLGKLTSKYSSKKEDYKD